MADLSITAASVIAGANAVIRHGTAGAALTAGQQLYYDDDAGTWKLADSNSATAAARVAEGTALHSAASGQPIAVHVAGDITIGAALSAGVGYYLSDTPGGICPVADVGSGEYPCFLGFASSASVLVYAPRGAGVAL